VGKRKDLFIMATWGSTDKGDWWPQVYLQDTDMSFQITQGRGRKRVNQSGSNWSVSHYLRVGQVEPCQCKEITAAWGVDLIHVTDVYLSPDSFPESKVTAGEKGSEPKRQMQNGGRHAKFLSSLYLRCESK
jgi:hypothetical protein